jgi:LysM repeat protein
MKFQIFAFLTFVSLVSCSSNKNISDDMDSDVQDSVGLEDENTSDSNESVNEEEYSQDTIEEGSEDGSQMADSSTPELTGDEGFYTVEKGDTLMLISFKLYGDYAKWKNIQNLNPEISTSANLVAGRQIKIIKPSEEFSWQPSGSPYLIKRNDSLQKISENLYETPNNWNHLYEHNKPLIKNPDVIFAGFTIFYLSAQELNRDPATAQRTEETREDLESNPYPEMDDNYDARKADKEPETVAQAKPKETAEELDAESMMAEESEPEAVEFDEE